MKKTKEEILNELLQPSDHLISDIAALDGDLLILGAGGKMGPNLARVAKQAIDKAGVVKRVIAVARFSEIGLQKQFEQEGVETIKADLLNENELQALPNVKNVIYMAGVKFGTQSNAALTWVMNSYLPGRVAQKFKESKIVVFSTGNIYPLTPVPDGGATENTTPYPVGEYGQSCLGRERVFQYFAGINDTPLFLYRLNYANDVTYGVLLEIAKAVNEGKPIDLSMGHFNAIWQGDANEIAIRALHHCSTPATIVNVSGPETISVKRIAGAFGRMLGKEAIFVNEEKSTALLSNTSQCSKMFGYPKVSLAVMMELVANWMIEGGRTLQKPTNFQQRDGKF